MRTFIIRSLKGPTGPNFSVQDRYGKNRLDIVCNFLVNALCTSHDIRKDTKVHIVLEGGPTPPVIVTFDGSTLKGITPHEEGFAVALRNALTVVKSLSFGEQKEYGAGIIVEKNSFEQLIKNYIASTQVYYLHPDGKAITTIQQDNPVFVVGDRHGIPEKSESLLERIGAKKITVGNKMLYASQCATIVQYELDKK